MSRSNFVEMKNRVIFCRKVISQGFWCNYPYLKSVHLSHSVLYFLHLWFDAGSIRLCTSLKIILTRPCVMSTRVNCVVVLLGRSFFYLFLIIFLRFKDLICIFWYFKEGFDEKRLIYPFLSIYFIIFKFDLLIISCLGFLRVY